jgi:SAM-dependent methyltransferase
MPPGQLAGYYQGEFGSERHRKGQIVNATTNLRILSGQMDLSKVGSWLDVGTGYGYLLTALRERYKMKVCGVELSKIEAAYARKNHGLTVASSFAEYPKRSFDVVSSFEVIEHTESPIAFLRELSEYVAPGGRLIVMTDNFECPAVAKLAGGFPKWIPHSHISHFSAATLRRCIQECGLEVEAEVSFDPPDVFARCLVSAFRNPPLDRDAFNLNSTLATEMKGDYRFFKVRRWLNPLWAKVTNSRSAEGGSLMYMICRAVRGT